MRAKAGGGAAGTASMAWVTEYDETFADEGTVDLKALTGSTWTDQYSVDWTVYAAANLSAYGINANGVGPEGTHTSGTDYAYIVSDLADLVAVGGGDAYDPHTDVVDLFFIISTLGNLNEANDIAYMQIGLHSGAYSSHGIASVSGATNRRSAIADNTTSEQTTLTVDSGWTSGVIAIRIVGTEVGGAYAKNDTGATLDFDSLTAIQTQRYMAARVAQGVGNDETPTRTITLGNQIVGTTGTKEWKVSRLVVKRYRAVLV